MDTFKKRQKEIQRMERRKDKAAKRIEKKLRGPDSPEDEAPLSADEAPAAPPPEVMAALQAGSGSGTV
jgi:hypothetical protein